MPWRSKPTDVRARPKLRWKPRNQSDTMQTNSNRRKFLTVQNVANPVNHLTLAIIDPTISNGVIRFRGTVVSHNLENPLHCLLRILLASTSLMLSILVAPLQAQTPHCGNWLSKEFFGVAEEFFGKATEQDVRQCVGSGLDPKLANEYGLTPLHVATRYGADPSVIQELIDVGADPNASSFNGLTPLHIAARYNDDPLVIEKLIDVGADPNSSDEERWTPLHWAAAGNKNFEVIEKLIIEGANPNLKDLYGRTPLYIAEVVENRPAIDSLTIFFQRDGDFES